MKTPPRTLAALAATAALALAILSAPSAGQGAAVITRGPVISHPEPGLATIGLISDQPCSLKAEIRVANAAPKTLTSQGLRHRFELRLPAATRFEYLISGPAGLVIKGASAMPPGPGAAFSFAALGDSGSGHGAQLEVAALLNKRAPDFAIHTGDIVYSSGEAEKQDPRFFIPYKTFLARAPFFVSLGNHDVQTKRGAPTLAAHDLPHNNPEGSERYYSFDWGDAHFIALDSNEILKKAGFIDKTAQGRWLKADLAATTKKWRIVFFHHPPYSCMLSRVITEILARHRVAKVFEEGGVDVVFNGHDHLYHRSVPMKKSKPAEDGITYVVTGGGGRGLYEGARRSYTAGFGLRHHAVFCQIKGDTLSLEAVDPRGEVVFDKAVIKARR